MGCAGRQRIHLRDDAALFGERWQFNLRIFEPALCYVRESRTSMRLPNEFIKFDINSTSKEIFVNARFIKYYTENMLIKDCGGAGPYMRPK
ncbi:MAG TPA: hypothetical protein VK741_12825 [Acetobacteraceae bacterium]|nr:hypothetical protein [Acetobacteraceae bacterium]